MSDDKEEFIRPYSLSEQKAFNERCAENINNFWKQYGLEANAHVEEKLVFVERAGHGKGRRCWSHEIVSSVPSFSCIKKQTLGVL